MAEHSMVWQPVMLVVKARVECDCGAKAIFIQLGTPDELDADTTDTDYGYVAWCQDCWARETEGAENGNR